MYSRSSDQTTIRPSTDIIHQVSADSSQPIHLSQAYTGTDSRSLDPLLFRLTQMDRLTGIGRNLVNNIG